MRVRTVLVTAAVAVGSVTAVTPAISASAASPHCSWTVRRPGYVYAQPAFTAHKLRGKHTGAVVTSARRCGDFDRQGFTSVRLGGGGTGWMYAGDLTHPAPRPPAVTSYQVYVRDAAVRTAPSATRGAAIKVKHRFETVTSPNAAGVTSAGYVAVNLSGGELGWFPANDLLQ